MVVVKTILGSFDTSTKSFVTPPKKILPPIQEGFKSFKLVTAPPRIINVTRFGGQVFQEVKRATSVPRAQVKFAPVGVTSPKVSKVNIRAPAATGARKARQETIREIFARRRRGR